MNKKFVKSGLIGKYEPLALLTAPTIYSGTTTRPASAGHHYNVSFYETTPNYIMRIMYHSQTTVKPTNVKSTNNHKGIEKYHPQHLPLPPPVSDRSSNQRPEVPPDPPDTYPLDNQQPDVAFNAQTHSILSPRGSGRIAQDTTQLYMTPRDKGNQYNTQTRLPGAEGRYYNKTSFTLILILILLSHAILTHTMLTPTSHLTPSKKAPRQWRDTDTGLQYQQIKLVTESNRPSKPSNLRNRSNRPPSRSHVPGNQESNTTQKQPEYNIDNPKSNNTNSQKNMISTRPTFKERQARVAAEVTNRAQSVKVYQTYPLPQAAAPMTKVVTICRIICEDKAEALRGFVKLSRDSFEAARQITSALVLGGFSEIRVIGLNKNDMAVVFCDKQSPIYQHLLDLEKVSKAEDTSHQNSIRESFTKVVDCTRGEDAVFTLMTTLKTRGQSNAKNLELVTEFNYIDANQEVLDLFEELISIRVKIAKGIYAQPNPSTDGKSAAIYVEFLTSAGADKGIGTYCCFSPTASTHAPLNVGYLYPEPPKKAPGSKTRKEIMESKIHISTLYDCGVQEQFESVLSLLSNALKNHRLLRQLLEARIINGNQITFKEDRLQLILTLKSAQYTECCAFFSTLPEDHWIHEWFQPKGFISHPDCGFPLAKHRADRSCDTLLKAWGVNECPTFVVDIGITPKHPNATRGFRTNQQGSKRNLKAPGGRGPTPNGGPRSRTTANDCFLQGMPSKTPPRGRRRCTYPGGPTDKRRAGARTDYPDEPGGHPKHSEKRCRDLEKGGRGSRGNGQRARDHPQIRRGQGSPGPNALCLGERTTRGRRVCSHDSRPLVNLNSLTLFQISTTVMCSMIILLALSRPNNLRSSTSRIRIQHILLLITTPVAAQQTAEITTGAVVTINIMLATAIKLIVIDRNSLSLKDYLTRAIEGDGNCFFRAICRFDLFSNYTDGGNNHLTLRRKTVFHIKRVLAEHTHPLHAKYTEAGFMANIISNNDTLENLYDRINDYGKGWGGYSDLPFISDLLNIEFRVLCHYREENKENKEMEIKHCWYPPVQPTFANENTVVAWLYSKENHYTAMIPKTGRRIPKIPRTTPNIPSNSKIKLKPMVPNKKPYPPKTQDVSPETCTAKILKPHPPIKNKTKPPPTQNVNKEKEKELKIMAINIQSINAHDGKRLEAVESQIKEHRLKGHKIHVLGLTETWAKSARELHKALKFSKELKEYHLITDADTETDIPQETGRGTALLISRDLAPYRQQTFKIKGVYTEISLEKEQEKILIAIVYKPHVDKENASVSEIKEIKARINLIRLNEKYNDYKAIFLGDWNEVINPALDQVSASDEPPIPKPFMNNKVFFRDNLINSITDIPDGDTHAPLIDIWREHHPQDLEFTHVMQTTKKKYPSKKRIDNCLVKLNTVESITSSWIDHNLWDINLHHKAIGVTVKLQFTDLSPKPPPATTNLFFAKGKGKPERTDNFLEKLNSTIKTTSPQDIPDSTDFHNSIKISMKHAKLTKTGTQKKTTYKMEIFKPTWIKILRQITNLQLQKNETIDAEERAELKTRCKQLLVKLNKKVTGEDFPKTKKFFFDAEFTELKRKVNKIQKREKYKVIAEAITSRSRAYIDPKGTKRVINNMLERERQTADTLLYVRDPLTNKIKTSPKDIHKILVDYRTEVHKNKPLEPGEIMPFHIDPDVLYRPLEEIKDEWYAETTRPIKYEELAIITNRFPKNKAPGVTGEGYDIFQAIINQDQDSPSVTALLQLINDIYRTGILPTAEKLGRIIMLPKDSIWKGLVDRLRPITLLESIRKIVESILQTRLQKVFTEHEILKSMNFGFRPGCSTNEAITALKIIIDTSNLTASKKITLFMAVLDVLKAFDKVPFDGLKLSMTRIKIPKQLINLSKGLCVDNKCTISTPHGETEQFNKENGLPQGGVISTLHWSVFYDVLQCLLDSETEGFIIPGQTRKITSVGFADDLTPIAVTAKDFQKQLDIIYSFLRFHRMEMGSSKSHVLTNLHPNSPEFPGPESFKLGEVYIKSVKQPSEITKILGAWISLDSKTQATRKLALKNFEAQITILAAKTFHGPQIAHLIQTTINEVLVYRLNHVPITKTDALSIDRSVRKIIRKCCNLPASTNIEIFKIKELLINVKPILQTLDARLISNTLVALTSKNRYGTFIRDMFRNVQIKFKLPLPLYEAPIELGKPHSRLKNTLIGKINDTLLRNDMQIRNIEIRDNSYTLGEENIFRLLRQETYAAQHKEIKEILQKYETMAAIIKTPNSRRGPSDIETLPFSTIANRLPKAKKKKILNQTTGDTLAPDWMRQITARFDVTREFNFTESVKLKPPELYKEPEKSLITSKIAKKVEMWTDGAYKPETTGMGAAAVFVDPEKPQETINWVHCKPGPNTPSALKTELIAIIFGLLHVDRDVEVEICTDSERTITGIKKFRMGIQNRSARKENHHDLFFLLLDILLNNFDTEPVFRKVESKEDELNIMADTEAKRVRDDENSPLFDISPSIMTSYDPTADLFLYHNETRVVQYPTIYLRQLHEKRNFDTISEYIKLKNPEIHRNDEILPKQTIQAAVELIDDENKRDRGNYKTATYNISSFSNKLETRDKLHRYKFILDKSTSCPRCNTEEETSDHILKCPDSIERYPAILEEATKVLQRELDRVWATNEAIQTRYTKPSPEIIWTALEANEATILEKPIARGIITRTLVESFKNKVLVETESLTRKARNPPFITEDTIGLATAALTTALYQEIWKPRTKYIFSENSKLHYQQKKEKWRQEREKKQAKKEQDKKTKKDKASRDKAEQSKQTKTATKNQQKKKGSQSENPTQIKRLNLKRDIKKHKKIPPNNSNKRKDRVEPAETPKPKKRRTLPHNHEEHSDIFPEQPRPKRKVLEELEIAAPPKKRRKEIRNPKP
jgi:ribonuclease HI